MSTLSLNYNIESHKYLEIINGGDKTIVLFSDDGSTSTKETHQFSAVSKDNGFLEAGMTIRSVTTEKATGSWEDRYVLEYRQEDAPETVADEAFVPEEPAEETDE